MYKKISKKVVLSSLMAAICSGVGTNALEANNLQRNMINNPVGNNFLNDNIGKNQLPNKENKENKEKGFSGLAMAGSNFLSLIGGGVIGYGAAKATETGIDFKKYVTKKEYDDLKSDYDALKKQGNGADIAGIQELKTKFNELKNDLKTKDKELEELKKWKKAVIEAHGGKENVELYKRMNMVCEKIREGDSQKYINDIADEFGKQVGDKQKGINLGNAIVAEVNENMHEGDVADMLKNKFAVANAMKGLNDEDKMYVFITLMEKLAGLLYQQMKMKAALLQPGK